ncbi:hypothetical protein L6164_007676 [Bauhinia variegata]|uniref:Uncharacterized protein n=1 Tax=Bauhinia variegata TaxID=167791 RepID=A0ACB9PDJ9_BAUVA|nr:hypothetical protein L6164_007676 [Bauhinia variegata]
MPNTSSHGNGTQSSSSALEVGGNGEEQQKDTKTILGHGWWNKVLDFDEAKKQILFALPMVLNNLFYYMIPLISLMLAGHFGELQLAGATLANSWNVVSGLGVVTGLSGALETLCGQAFGAEEYQILGVYLQASCIVSTLFSIIISIIWFFTEPILVLLHQSHDIARTAASYMKFLIPGLFAYGYMQNIMRFLQTQSVVTPLIVLSGVPLLIHVGIAYAFVHGTALKFKGAALAVSVSFWISMLLLVFYVKCGKKFKQTWKGFSVQSFHYILTDLKLALPSATMSCLEYWAFEVLVILAGLLPNSEISTSLIAICVNTQAIGYMITVGLSAAVSTRVSNELGADHPDRAKVAMGVSVKLTLICAFCVILALVFGHSLWISLFSKSTRIKEEFAAMRPLLAATLLLDAVQGVLSGVARGCGWQNIGVYVNLVAFYFVGMPISIILAFKTKLHAKGLWTGLICGLTCQNVALFLLTKLGKWTKLNVSGDGGEANAVAAY